MGCESYHDGIRFKCPTKNRICCRLRHPYILAKVKVHATAIEAVRLLEPARHIDERGFLSEVYNEATLTSLGITDRFVQENHILSTHQGTLRGLHFQIPPKSAAKLVRVVSGSIFDVAVDLRRNEPSFGSWVSSVLTAHNWRQMFIPDGFAHGFCTLEPKTEVSYLTSSFWDPEFDRGLRWDDPSLAISWPVSSDEVTISSKDKRLPFLADLDSYF